MTREENLLVVALEECSEIQQELSKCLRFGVGNNHPNDPNITNGKRIMREYEELQATIHLLIQNGVLPSIDESESMLVYKNKMNSIEKWADYSESIGRITAS